MNIQRIIRHLWSSPRLVQQTFPAPAMSRIGAAIRNSEGQHRGQIRFAVEGALAWSQLIHNANPSERALDAFTQLRVWDTEENNGVLIYLLLADRHVEIVADRGVHERVGASSWESICRRMEQNFSLGHFETGVLEGIEAVTEVLAKEYPSTGGAATNELPDEPVIIQTP